MTHPSPARPEGDSTAAASSARRALDRAGYDRFLPIIRRIAMRYARRLPAHITVADLTSCGWVGLMEALARAPSDMAPNEFEAYAVYRIRGAMLDHVRSLDTATRDARAASRRLSDTIKTLTGTLGRPPNEGEIAQAMALSLDDYHALLLRIADAGCTRLELADVDELEHDPAGERSVEDEAARRELGSVVAEAIETLPPRLQHVLALYYQHNCTLREIGEVLGVTESRVSQLHTEAIHRLRGVIATR